MTCLILQSLRNETCNISLDIFPRDDILQMPSQGVSPFDFGVLWAFIETCYSFQKKTWTLRREQFFLRKIILMEALFAKITSEIFLKLHFQKTHIGLVYLTKHAIFFFPFLWRCLRLAKGRQILY